MSTLSTPTSTPGASSSNAHLSFPSSKSRSPTPPPAAAPVREILKNRLYVGNLHPTVDEYTFLQVFSRYGKISKLDFLFHKAGPSRGKPRGYAFVEYSDKDDAMKALVGANDKLLRGRKITVTYANQAPDSEPFNGTHGKHHRRFDAQRPTALSLIKTSSRPGKTEDKIAALEAKLRQMEKSADPGAGASSTLPAHPSLPAKPPPALPSRAGSSSDLSKANGSSKAAKLKSGSVKEPTLDELLKRDRSGTNGSGSGLGLAGLVKR